MPLTTDAVETRVSASNGRVRSVSMWPPQRSTTFCPRQYTVTPAPSSRRDAKFSVNVSSTGVKAGAHSPAIDADPLSAAIGRETEIGVSELDMARVIGGLLRAGPRTRPRWQ